MSICSSWSRLLLIESLARLLTGWEFWCNQRPQIRHYQLEFAVRCPVRLLYISDLHLSPWNASAKCVSQMLQLVEQTRPDYLLLGGDLLDLGLSLHLLSFLVQESSRICPVLVISGNHDRWLLHGSKLFEAVNQAGGSWLGEPYLTPQGLSLISELWLWGNSNQALPANTLLVAHNPSVFPLSVKCSVPLTLAGHLHGCQVIAWERSEGSLQRERSWLPWLHPRPLGRYCYPGAWFFTYNGWHFQAEGPQSRNCHMIVSAGINDPLPIRFGCPRDVLLIELKPDGSAVEHIEVAEPPQPSC